MPSCGRSVDSRTNAFPSGILTTQTVGVGDAFHTDMAGARKAGIDGVFCSGGIHADELATRYGQPPDPRRLKSLADAYPGLTPVAAIGGFAW